MLKFKSVKTKKFRPISDSKNIYKIKSGIFNIKERINKKINKKNIDIKKNNLFLNETLIDIYINNISKNYRYYNNNSFIAAYFDKKKDIEELPKKEINFDYLKAKSIWDYILNLGKMIKNDFKLISKKDRKKISDLKIELIGDKNKLYIKKNSNIYPGTIFDTSKGPIYIEDGVEIRPFSFLQGPLYIGQNSVIDDAKLRSDTHIGKVCKISGEIENTVIHSYSNKHHGGFIGHSYIGSWVNLGAYTTNSDLKNNYGNVRYPIGKNNIIDTGRMKIGTCIGDHVKTGIGTLINTGSFIGFGSMIYGGGVFPKFIPSFSWATAEKWNEYILKKFIKNEKKVMSRRDIKMSNDYKRLINNIFKNTKENRENMEELWQS